tara:strand:- start:181 stop:303 length:123 start_codon:yes stop_codon:yes gene_type:complete
MEVFGDLHCTSKPAIKKSSQTSTFDGVDCSDQRVGIAYWL